MIRNYRDEKVTPRQKAKDMLRMAIGNLTLRFSEELNPESNYFNSDNEDMTEKEKEEVLDYIEKLISMIDKKYCISVRKK